MLLIILMITAQSLVTTAQESGWYSAFLTPVVEAAINQNSSGTVLDIGTGAGKLPEMMVDKDPHLTVTAIDIDSAAINMARKRSTHKAISFQYQVVNDTLNFQENKFDVVTICSVLFLVDEETKRLLVNESLRVLKPGGTMIVLTPSGKKSFFTSWIEIWRYPFSFRNWTFIAWRTFTSPAGRRWQKQQWLAHYAIENQLSYTRSLVFNNNASMEIITKSSNN